MMVTKVQTLIVGVSHHQAALKDEIEEVLPCKPC